jgi:hypothetical protein
MTEQTAIRAATDLTIRSVVMAFSSHDFCLRWVFGRIQSLGKLPRWARHGCGWVVATKPRTVVAGDHEIESIGDTDGPGTAVRTLPRDLGHILCQ